jgi:hypothetical protein
LVAASKEHSHRSRLKIGDRDVKQFFNKSEEIGKVRFALKQQEKKAEIAKDS